MKLPAWTFDVLAFAVGPFLIVAFRSRGGFQPFEMVSLYEPFGDTWLFGPGPRALFATGVALLVVGALMRLHLVEFRPRDAISAALIASGVFALAAGLTAPENLQETSPFWESTVGGFIIPGPRLLSAIGASLLCLGLVRSFQRQV